jgi:hypothetical protein
VTDESFTLDPPSREAEFDSRCPGCGGDIVEGEVIFFDVDYAHWVCGGCAERV